MITIAELEAEVKKLEAEFQQLVANSNATHGAYQYAVQLLAKAKAAISSDETKVDAEVKTVETEVKSEVVKVESEV